MSEITEVTIELSAAEALLISTLGVNPLLASRLKAQQSRARFSVRLTLDDADDLREALLEEMVKRGFDASYELTTEGAKFRSLADRIYDAAHLGTTEGDN